MYIIIFYKEMYCLLYKSPVNKYSPMLTDTVL